MNSGQLAGTRPGFAPLERDARRLAIITTPVNNHALAVLRFPLFIYLNKLLEKLCKVCLVRDAA